MAEYKSPGGIILPNGAPWDVKSDRVQQASIPRNITSVMAESKFRDFSSYLRAIKIPWVYSCVSLISSSFADSHWDLFDGKDAVEDPNNLVLQLFMNPNPHQSGFEFLELMAMYMELTGEVFISLEERDGHGRPHEMYLPNPARMRVLPDPDKYIKGYVYETGQYNPFSFAYSTGQFIPYDPDEIVHIKMPNPMDDYRGFGAIEAGEDLLNIVTAMQTNEYAYWSAGGRITGVLETTVKVSDEDFVKIKNEWQAFSRDTKNRYKTAILEQGLKYSPVAEGMKGIDSVGIDKNKRDTILALFGVPAPKLGIVENAQYKQEDADRVFWSETMWPKFRRFEDGIQPLIDLFDSAWVWRFTRTNFEDDTTKLTNAKAMQGLYCYTSNDIRAYTGASELGDDGEVIWIPNNMIPVKIDHVSALADRDEQQAQAALDAASAPPPGPGGDGTGGGTQGPTQGPPGGLGPNHPAVSSKPPTVRGRTGAAQPGATGTSPETAKALEMVRYQQQAAAKIVARNLRERGAKAIATPMGRIQIMDEKRMARNKLPGPPRTASGNSPVVAERLIRHRDQTQEALVKRFQPILRDGFRKQQRNVIKVIGKMPRNGNLSEAVEYLRKNWDSKPIRDALIAMRILGGHDGYEMGTKALPPRHAQVLRARKAAAESEAKTPAWPQTKAADDGGLSGDFGAVVDATDLGNAGIMNEALMNPLLADEALDPMLALRLSGNGLDDRIDGIDSTTLEDLQQVIAEGVRRGYSPLQIANGVEDEKYDGIMGVFDAVSDYRAELISRTEAMSGYNWGSVAAYQDAGVKQVEALDGDYDLICSERNGKLFDLDPDLLEPVDKDGQPVEDHPNGTLAWAPIEDPNVNYLGEAPPSSEDSSLFSYGQTSASDWEGKGDSPGHEFRGNQYSEISQAANIHSFMSSVEDHGDHFTVKLPGEGHISHQQLVKELQARGYAAEYHHDHIRVTKQTVGAKYSDSQERDNSGRWTSGGGGDGADDKPVKTTDVNEAARLLIAGRKVELQQPRQVSTVLSKLAAIANEAKAAGKNATKYNLCNLSVPGTNLFCADSKIPSRNQMPQLGGVPKPGSLADSLPHIDKGPGKPYEVDTTPGFIEHLQNLGFKVTQTTEQAAYLRATQHELEGVKVAGMMVALQAGKSLGSGAILTSQDNYIVDGHHRWAAEVGLDTADGHLGNSKAMPIQKVNMDILPLIALANSYAEAQGMPKSSMKRLGGSTDDPENPAKSVRSKDVSAQPRDDHGRFSFSNAPSMGAHAVAESSVFTDSTRVPSNADLHSHLRNPLPDHSSGTLRDHIENVHGHDVSKLKNLSDLVEAHWHMPHKDANRGVQAPDQKYSPDQPRNQGRFASAADYAANLPPEHQKYAPRWTANNPHQAAALDALARIAGTGPQTAHGEKVFDTVATSFPYEAQPTLRDAVRGTPTEKVDFPLNKLTATEQYMSRNAVAAVIHALDEGPKGPDYRPGYDPIVAHKDGKDYIVDGHHRLSGAAYLGHETIPVQFVNLDK